MKSLVIWLGANHKQLFKTDLPIFVDQFCKDGSTRGVIENYYNTLVAEGNVTPIENLDTELKHNIKQLAFKLGDKKLDVVGMVQLCKCLQVMRYHQIL